MVRRMTPNAKLVLTRMPFYGTCGNDDGAGGCGTCKQCKRNRQRALAREVEADRPYLGLKPFAQLFPEPRWMKAAHGVMEKGEPARYVSLTHRFPPPEER